MRRLAILVTSFLLSAGVTYGQSRGAMHASTGVRMSAPVAIGHAAPVAGGMRGGSNGVVRAASGTHLVVRNGQIHVRSNGAAVRPIMPRTNRPRPAIVQEEGDTSSDFNPVPGLGFDVPHWAATHGQGAAGRRRHSREFAAFFPFFDGGFMVAPQTIVEDEPTAEAQQVDSAPQREESESKQRLRYREQTEGVPQVVTAEPQHDSEQYVFVRRDGTIIFAVAYTWEQGNLRYVTTEGMRRSVSLDSLDLDATRQFNEQRGLNFRLPA